MSYNSLKYIIISRWIGISLKLRQRILRGFGNFSPGFRKLSTFLKKYRLLAVKDLQLRLNLTTKWMLATLIFIISFSIILVSFFIHSGKNDLEKELKKWGSSLATNLAYSARYAVFVKDYETLQNYLVGIMNEKEVIYSAILDDNGSILAIVDPNWIFTTKIQDFSIQAMDKNITEFQTTNRGVYYNIVKSIEFEKEDNPKKGQLLFKGRGKHVSELSGLQFRPSAPSSSKKLGTIVLGISLENMKVKLNRMRDKAIFITLVIALICICVVFLGFEKMTAPIKQLVKATEKVARGDLTHFVRNNRKDELGLLADSFNEMIVTLKKSQNKVKNYTLTLEKRVSERTRDLKESEKKYRTLFEHSGTAVTIIEEDERLSMVNREFEVLSGYSKTEVEGQMFLSSFLAKVDLKEIRESCKKKRKAYELTAPINHEFTFVDRFGNRKNVNLTMSLIPGTKKILASLADVTELKRLQRQLIRSEQLAAIGELSAAIAHEIRNPLVAINTSVGILKNGLDVKGEERELIGIICEETTRLNKIIEDFLQFAHPNIPQFRDTNINGLLQETLLLFRERMGNNIKKNVKFAKNLPSILVDPNQIKQVMINIIINSIESMPAGGLLTVSTHQVQNRFGDHYIEIVVRDTGHGIKESDLKKIFQPFYSTKEKGSGMGLAICERIIQNHGGDIKVESKSGKGVKFTIALPVQVNVHPKP